jgi:hypothetical protein
LQNTTATLLLNDDKIATARDAFAECDEKDLEAYLMFLCCPNFAVECTFQGGELYWTK